MGFLVATGIVQRDKVVMWSLLEGLCHVSPKSEDKIQEGLHDICSLSGICFVSSIPITV